MRTMMRLQGLYFLATGLWPVVNVSSFMWVTGPKQEIWLVKTLGLMFACMGAGFLTWKHFDRISLMLPFCVSGCLAATDIYYWLNGTISMIYVGDALVELIFASYWLARLTRKPAP